MIRALIIFFTIFATFLFGNSLNQEILKESKMISKSGREKSVRLYHTLKNLYIKAIINEDKTSQINAIKALIVISKKLKLPYKHYIEELNLLTNKKGKTPIAKSDKKSFNNLPKVVSISSKKNSVFIYFDKKIDKSDISFYELNSKKSFRDIFDIRAKIFFKVKPIKVSGIDSVRVSRYKKDIVRVVLKSSKPINSTFSIEKDRIFITVNSKKKYKKRSSRFNYFRGSFSNNIIDFRDKIVVLDPGHGGKDCGAIGYNGFREKDAVLRIAKKVGKYLKRFGFKVYYTRSRDIFIKLRERTHFANIKNADIFISIHANAAPKKSQYLTSKGVETYFLSPAKSKRAKRVSAKENSVDISNMDYYSKQVFLNFLNREKIISSNKLAIDIQRGILKSVRKRYDLVDGGVRSAPFWVLVGAQMPSVLIETGFITNPTEAKRLFNPYYEDLFAKGIANGVVSYFEKNR